MVNAQRPLLHEHVPISPPQTALKSQLLLSTPQCPAHSRTLRKGSLEALRNLQKPRMCRSIWEENSMFPCSNLDSLLCGDKCIRSSCFLTCNTELIIQTPSIWSFLRQTGLFNSHWAMPDGTVDFLLDSLEQSYPISQREGAGGFLSFSFLNSKMERGLTEDKDTTPVVPGRPQEESERAPSTLAFDGAEARRPGDHAEEAKVNRSRGCGCPYERPGPRCVEIESSGTQTMAPDLQPQRYLRTCSSETFRVGPSHRGFNKPSTSF